MSEGGVAGFSYSLVTFFFQTRLYYFVVLFATIESELPGAISLEQS